MSGQLLPPAAAGQEPRLSRRQQLVQIKAELETMNAQALAAKRGEMGKPMVAAKGTRGQSGTNGLVITTNVYGMMTKKKVVYRYDFNIYGLIHKRTGDVKVSLMTATGDTRIAERRYMRMRAFLYFQEQHRAVIPEGAALFYGGSLVLYSTERLLLPRGEKSWTYTITNLDEGIFDTIYALEIEVALPETGTAEIEVDDVGSAISGNLEEVSTDLAQFIEVATSHFSLINCEDTFSFSPSEFYLEHPQNHGFQPVDFPSFKESLSKLEIGIRKNTRFVEGPGGIGCAHPAVVVASHKRDFLETCLLSDRVRTVAKDPRARLTDEQLEALNARLGGMYAETTYGKKQRLLRVSEVVAARPSEQLFKSNGGQTTVEQYFKQRYGHQCENLPLIAVKDREGEANYFPSELLKTAPYQRVPVLRARKTKEGEGGPQEGDESRREMVKAIAVPPIKRMEDEDKLKDILKLDYGTDLHKANITVIGERLVVADARRLEGPGVVFKEGGSQPDATTGMAWDGGKYIRSTQVMQWSLLGLCIRHESIGMEDLKKCAELMVYNGNNKGMLMSTPRTIEALSWQPNTARGAIEEAQRNGDDFVLLVHPGGDVGDKVHAQMKLWERTLQITTQGVLIHTVKQANAEGQPVTVTNILNKTNVKLGGLNYNIQSDAVKDTDLVIGIGASHPSEAELWAGNAINGMSTAGLKGVTAPTAPSGSAGPPRFNGANGGKGHNGSAGPPRFNGANGGNGNGRGNAFRFRTARFPPSAIGFSANIHPSGDPYEFVGDFMLQEVRREEKPELIARIVRMCAERFTEVRGRQPERIIIYRNGCAEGQWAGILKYEVPNIDLALEELGLLIDPVIVVISKLHQIRFYDIEINAEAGPPQQNIQPGTVIDSTVVHPIYCEFYLNTHRALQGTAKTPRYNVLYNPIEMSMDEVQLMSNALAYGHQIVNSPTSLPTPAYVAEEYAKRGLNLFVEWYQNETLNGGLSAQRINKMTFDEIEEVLSYSYTRLFAERRINA